MMGSDPHLTPPSSQPAGVEGYLYRYIALLRRRWWIVLLAISLAVCVQAVLLKREPESFTSIARMWLSGRVRVSDVGYSEDLQLSTQVELLRSPNIQARARARVQALKPDLNPVEVQLEINQFRNADIIVLRALGSEPKFAQAYLQAVMEEYLEYKKEIRTASSDTSVQTITDQLAAAEKELKEQQSRLHTFQEKNNLDILRELHGSAAAYMARLRTQKADLDNDLEFFKNLTPEQQLESRSLPTPPVPKDGKSDDKSESKAASSTSEPVLAQMSFSATKQQIQMLKLEREERGIFMRPSHPKMVDLDLQIQRLEKSLEVYRSDALTELEQRRKNTQARIKTLDDQIKDWEAKALEANTKMTEFARLREIVDRARAQYDRLADVVQKINYSSRFNTENLSVLEPATEGRLNEKDLPKTLGIAAIAGLLASLGLLFLLDRLDPRINTVAELGNHFNEPLIGQIPDIRPEINENEEEYFPLLQSDDTRHMYAEAYRNIRSSLLFMETAQFKPKTFLVTSAIPDEGKSTITANLGLTMANAGNRVLLVDADLRRGALHEAFQVKGAVGLTEVLRRQAELKDAIQPTANPNLFLLPRGTSSNHAGELFLSTAMDGLLRETQEQFDFVIFDSAPILATDDAPTLAPKIDGTLMVVRASFTAAKLSRTALAQLYQRGVNVLGILFNRISSKMTDYYYYKHADYYAAKAVAPETSGDASTTAEA